MSPENKDPLAVRFWKSIAEDEYRFLSDPRSWPRAYSAWKVYGAGTRYCFCLYCDEAFRKRGGKRNIPHFCSAACHRNAMRVRKEYREQMIRDLFAEGTSYRMIGWETGLSHHVVKIKRYEMKLPPHGEDPRNRR